MIEHSIGTPFARTARMIASCNASVTVAVAGGLFTIGEYHGGAISSRMSQKSMTVKNL